MTSGFRSKVKWYISFFTKKKKKMITCDDVLTCHFWRNSLRIRKLKESIHSLLRNSCWQGYFLVKMSSIVDRQPDKFSNITGSWKQFSIPYIGIKLFKQFSWNLYGLAKTLILNWNANHLICYYSQCCLNMGKNVLQPNEFPFILWGNCDWSRIPKTNNTKQQQ